MSAAALTLCQMGSTIKSVPEFIAKYPAIHVDHWDIQNSATVFDGGNPAGNGDSVSEVSNSGTGTTSMISSGKTAQPVYEINNGVARISFNGIAQFMEAVTSNYQNNSNQVVMLAFEVTGGAGAVGVSLNDGQTNGATSLGTSNGGNLQYAATSDAQGAGQSGELEPTNGLTVAALQFLNGYLYVLQGDKWNYIGQVPTSMSRSAVQMGTDSASSAFLQGYVYDIAIIAASLGSKTTQAICRATREALL